MIENDISRRKLLEQNTGNFAADSQDEQATDPGPSQYNIGIRSQSAAQAVRTQSDQVDRVFDWGNNKKTITGQFPDQVVEDIQNNPDIRYIEQDGQMRALDQTLPWGIDRVDAETAHSHGETGGDDTNGANGVDIAILDTGIDSDHPDLAANIGNGKAFEACTSGSNDCHHPWDDDHGHGTHCAGIANAINNDTGVVGVSTAATLHAVKVLTSEGFGSYSNIAAGIRWVVNQDYDIVSMSLGGGKSWIVEDAVEYAYKKGVLPIAAAGNVGPCADCVGYPAAEPEVMAVSATANDDSLAVFSSTGPQVDLAAPGEDIYSTYTGGAYETFSGTSMACPHVSGAVAQLMDNGQSNTEARDTLEESAEDIGLGPNEQGYGLLDVAAALGIEEDENDDDEKRDDTEDRNKN